MISPVGSACGYKSGSADGLARSGSSKFTVSLKGGPWRAGSAVTATDGADANAARRGSRHSEAIGDALEARAQFDGPIRNAC